MIRSLISFLTGSSASNDAINRIGVQDFKQGIKPKGTQLVDVRTKREFQQGHIKKAVNIDLYQGGFAEKFSKFDKERPVYIYCRSGGRSASAARKLAKLGFTEIYDLAGGYMRWR